MYAIGKITHLYFYRIKRELQKPICERFSLFHYVNIEKYWKCIQIWLHSFTAVIHLKFCKCENVYIKKKITNFTSSKSLGYNSGIL